MWILTVTAAIAAAAVILAVNTAWAGEERREDNPLDSTDDLFGLEQLDLSEINRFLENKGGEASMTMEEVMGYLARGELKGLSDNEAGALRGGVCGRQSHGTGSDLGISGGGFY